MTWNWWRQSNPDITPDLSDANLDAIKLEDAILVGSNLRRASLRHAVLLNVDLTGSNLNESDLSGAVANNTTFKNAHLVKAGLRDAKFNNSNFNNTDLRGAILFGASFRNVTFKAANFTHARIYSAAFSDSDLGDALGLETMVHMGPSTIGVDTIYRSTGKITEPFLRNCGVPEDFITYMPSLVTTPIQYHSCFISYSHKDEAFAQRLHTRMRQSNLRVWYAPEDMAGGKKLHEQIEHAIQLHDRLLIVLSEHSLKSEWVMTEIRKARTQELKRGTRKLFPISLVDFDAIKEWECFDADSGKDLAVEVREYFIPDFSNWKDHDSFEAAFDRLYRDLKVEKAKAA